MFLAARRGVAGHWILYMQVVNFQQNAYYVHYVGSAIMLVLSDYPTVCMTFFRRTLKLGHIQACNILPNQGLFPTSCSIEEDTISKPRTLPGFISGKLEIWLDGSLQPTGIRISCFIIIKMLFNSPKKRVETVKNEGAAGPTGLSDKTLRHRNADRPSHAAGLAIRRPFLLLFASVSSFAEA